MLRIAPVLTLLQLMREEWSCNADVHCLSLYLYPFLFFIRVWSYKFQAEHIQARGGYGRPSSLAVSAPFFIESVNNWMYAHNNSNNNNSNNSSSNNLNSPQKNRSLSMKFGQDIDKKKEKTSNNHHRSILCCNSRIYILHFPLFFPCHFCHFFWDCNN